MSAKVQEQARAQNVKHLHELIHRMNLPSWRKNSTSTDNFRWLYRNLNERNSDHKNYDEAMQILEGLI